MRHHRDAAWMLVTLCLAAPSLATAAHQAPQADRKAATGDRPKPLTRRQAAEIMTNTGELAADVERQLDSPPTSRDHTATDPKQRAQEEREAAAIDDVRDVLAHAAEWRWYSRDHGILVAIPVQERLGLLAEARGEKALANVVRRLIDQKGWGKPPVQVVFIAPELPTIACGLAVVPVAACVDEAVAVPACDCD